MMNKIKGIRGAKKNRVIVDGRALAIKPSQRVVNHSDAFEWGYPGSGPAQLALALLLHVGIAAQIASRLHQEFKADVIVKLPQDADFEIEYDIAGWVRAKQLADEVGW